MALEQSIWSTRLKNRKRDEVPERAGRRERERRLAAHAAVGAVSGPAPALAIAKKVHRSYLAFRERVGAWSRISMQAVLKGREG